MKNRIEKSDQQYQWPQDGNTTPCVGRIIYATPKVIDPESNYNRSQIYCPYDKSFVLVEIRPGVMDWVDPATMEPYYGDKGPPQ